jgi:hypothetical protein
MGHYMAGAAGLEPTNHGVKVRCLTDLAMPQNILFNLTYGVDDGIRTHECRSHNPVS